MKQSKKSISKRYILAIVAVGIAAVLYAASAIQWDRSRQSTGKAASCVTIDKLVNPCRPWLAASVGKYTDNGIGSDLKSQVLYHEQRIGKQLDAIKDYRVAGQALSNDDVYFATRANTFLMLNWKPVANDWASANANNDAVKADIDKMANSIKSLGDHTVFLTLWHEPEDNVSTMDPSPACTTLKGTSGSPSDFVNMYRYVHDRFAEDNVTNVVWAVDFMNYNPWDCLINLLYPGDNYVDWIVFNAYGGADGKSYADNVSHFYNLLSSNSTPDHNYLSKQWGIAEWSARNATEDQGVSYFKQAQDVVDSNQFPKLKLYMTFDNVGPDGNENRVSYTKGGIFSQAKADAYQSFEKAPAFAVSSLPDTTVPHVSMVSPSSGTVVTGNTTLTANASDDTAVTNVAFYVDNTLISNDTQESDGWNATWNSVSLPDGTHVFKATATDAAGNAASANVSIVTNNTPAPVISSISASPTTLTIGDNTTLSWAVSDADKCSLSPSGPVNTTSKSWTSSALLVTTEFTLTCSGAGGTATAKTTVTVVPPPQITSFTATPSTITIGDSSALSWQTTNTTSCTVSPNGSTNTSASSWQTLSLTTAGTTTYTLQCQNAAGDTTSKTTTVTVNQPPQTPTNVVLTSSAQSVVSGGRITFGWTSKNASSCELDPGNYQATGTDGIKTIDKITKAATYYVTCKNVVGSTKSNSISITISSAPITQKPAILSFYAFPATITPGAQTKLFWATNNVTMGNCALTPSPLASTYSTGKWTTPALTASTTYTLTCTNKTGKVSATTRVTVSSTLGLARPGATMGDNIVLASAHLSGAPIAAAATQQLVSSQVSGDVPAGSLVTLDPNLATASGASNVTRVEYYDSQMLVQTLTTMPFALNTRLLKTAGDHTITERAYYGDGSMSEVAQLIAIGPRASSQKLSAWVIWTTGAVFAAAAVTIIGLLVLTVRRQNHEGPHGDTMSSPGTGAAE